MSYLDTFDGAKLFTLDWGAGPPVVLIPTLRIHGDSDDTVPIEATGREAARMIPDARLEVYNGSPHGLFVTDKDRLNADLTSFVLERATTSVARDHGVRPSL